MHKIVPPFVAQLLANLKASPQFVQVILGPRQVGKTTGVLQFLADAKGDSAYFSADDALAPNGFWIEEKWQQAQSQAKDCILVIDEIHKIPEWSNAVKKLWDRQRKDNKTKIKLILLGSSSLQIQSGLSESLTGRFQVIRATHWSLVESKKLINFTVQKFAQFGGYPGSYALLKNPKVWEKYIRESIVETVIGKDILNIGRIKKPALFRQAFEILMSHPAQEISYTKLLGQLQDSGNTDLVRSYLELYEGAFLVKALQKYSGSALVKKTSSPKLIPLCGALISREVFLTKDGFGRAFEAAVGAFLISHEFECYYWRDGDSEVDFVICYDGKVFAIEVKSGRHKSSKGLKAFVSKFPEAKILFVNPENVESFMKDPDSFLS